jgi:hypothetical protein
MTSNKDFLVTINFDISQNSDSNSVVSEIVVNNEVILREQHFSERFDSKIII